MANYGPSSAFLLVGGNDLSAESYSLDETVEEPAIDTRGLGVDMHQVKGLGVAMITLEASPGLYENDIFKQVAAYETSQGARKLISWGMEGEELGDKVAMVDGAFSSIWKRQTSRDGLTLAGATFNISGQLYGPSAEDGVGGARIVGIKTSRAGDGDSESASLDQASSASAKSIVNSNADDSIEVTAHGLETGDTVLIENHDSTPSIDGDQTVTVVDVDNFTIGVDITVGGTGVGTIKKTSTSSGLIADLHVPALDLGGGTNCVVLIQDSPDDSVWTTLGTFAAVTSESVGSSERIIVAGTVDRYLSITWTFTGGAAQSITPYVCAVRT